MTRYDNEVGNPTIQANQRTREMRLRIAGLVVISVLAFLPRLAMLQSTNLDLVDHFLPWLERIRTQGLWEAIATPFSRYGYPPFYSYTLGLADTLFPASPKSVHF